MTSHPTFATFSEKRRKERRNNIWKYYSSTLRAVSSQYNRTLNLISDYAVVTLPSLKYTLERGVSIARNTFAELHDRAPTIRPPTLTDLSEWVKRKVVKRAARHLSSFILSCISTLILSTAITIFCTIIPSTRFDPLIYTLLVQSSYIYDGILNKYLEQSVGEVIFLRARKIICRLGEGDNVKIYIRYIVVPMLSVCTVIVLETYPEKITPLIISWQVQFFLHELIVLPMISYYYTTLTSIDSVYEKVDVPSRPSITLPRNIQITDPLLNPGNEIVTDEPKKVTFDNISWDEDYFTAKRHCKKAQ